MFTVVVIKVYYLVTPATLCACRRTVLARRLGGYIAAERTTYVLGRLFRCSVRLYDSWTEVQLAVLAYLFGSSELGNLFDGTIESVTLVVYLPNRAGRPT